MPPLPAAARALLCAALAALLADGLLAFVTGLADVAGRGAAPPWWVAAHVVERSRWVVAALLLMAVGAWTGPARADDRPGIWRAVAAAVIVAPLIWTVAAWIVQAGLFTVAGRWDVDGRMFWSAELYRRAFVDYVPWLLGGVTTRAIAGHLR